MPLPWPSEDRPSPFTLRSWHEVELACDGVGAQGAACTDALSRVSASAQPTAMLVASAAWRHAHGDIYGSAHALRSALSILLSSNPAAEVHDVQAAPLFKEITSILQRVLDLTPPSPPSRLPASTPSPPSSLSSLYPAQITPFSDFAAALLLVCRRLPALRVVIEVGSGAGAGATSAIIGGALRRPLHQNLHVFLIEIGAERRARLIQRYGHLPFVRIIAASAIPLSAFPSAAKVAAAHAQWSAAEFGLSDALKWRQEDWDYVQKQGTAHDGIGAAIASAPQLDGGAGAGAGAGAKAGAGAGVGGGGRQARATAAAVLGGDGVDVAVLDGSEFTGWQELSQIYGARVIALDDTRTLKHRQSRAFLLQCGCYDAVADHLQDRNGWAVFERVPARACAPFP